ncbi:uncharacterized protein LOC113334263 [Papaver somniferum]|uniref:uncharacterized protein LOC113334263 n=1 Tax=Papaver somniferum TaxID=3469 RepID=UPI000E701B06|nr:uncharacterized protein LOC113334263 [Papaver somniferum]
MNIVNSKMDTLMEHVLGTKGKNVQPSVEPVNGSSTSKSSVGTSSVSPTYVPSTSSGSCELRNMNFEVVAIATIVTDDTKGIFHGYKLDVEREAKVILIKIVMPNTPIYKSGKQDGANIFEDVMEGGYLVWPKSLIIYECRS